MRKVDGLVGRRALGRLEGVGRTSQKKNWFQGWREKKKKIERRPRRKKQISREKKEYEFLKKGEIRAKKGPEEKTNY
jgi:hypothetical protein